MINRKFVKYFGYINIIIVSLMFGLYYMSLIDFDYLIEAEEVIRSNKKFLDEGMFLEVYKPGYDRHIYKNYEIYSVTYDGLGTRPGKFFWFIEQSFYRIQYFFIMCKNKFSYYYFLEVSHNLSFEDFLEMKGRKDLIRKNMMTWIVEKTYSFSLYFPVGNPPMFINEHQNGYFYKQITRTYLENVRTPFGDLFFLENKSFLGERNVFLFFLNGLLVFLGFLFFLSKYSIIFFVLFYYVLFYFYQTKMHSFITWLDIYVSEDDDFMMGYFEIMSIQGEYEKYDDYYNVSKNEHVFLLNIVFLDREVAKWVYFLNYTGKEKISQFFQLSMNINLLLVTKVDMISWLLETGSEEGHDWGYYPYEIIPTIFFEYDLYLKNYADNKVVEIDIGYAMFDYFLVDTMGVLKYDIHKHPMEDVRNVGESTVEYLYNDIHFKPDVFFKGSRYDTLILERFVERYVRIHKLSLEKNLSVEASIDYFGVLNNREELDMRTTDSGLNEYFHEFKLFEGYLSATTVPFRPFPEHIMEKLLKREDFRDLLKKFPEYIANPKDKRFKMVPRVWKEMDFTNFMFSVVNLSLLHFLIRSNVFWRDIVDMAELEEGGVNYYDERHDFSEDLELSGLFNKFEKNLPAMYGFGLGRKSQKTPSINLGTIVIFENLENMRRREYNVCLYPPYMSNIGANIVPLEYRFVKGQDFFYLRYILREGFSINSSAAHKLNFMNNAKFEEGLYSTYYVGSSDLPEGYSFMTTLDSTDNMYKNLNLKLEDSAYVFEEKDKNYETDYDNLEDGFEVVFFACVFPVVLFVNFVLIVFF